MQPFKSKCSSLVPIAFCFDTLFRYVPLGPFTSKNFATTVAPWIIPTQALESFRVSTSAGCQDNPVPLEYLQDPDYSSYDIKLHVAIQPENSNKSHVISKSNFSHLYWNPPQQLVHHSVTGCVMRAGDMLGSGTISGTEPTSFGSMLELSWKGTKEIPVGDGVRKFLQDGDSVIMTGFCENEGGRVGFGECRAKVLPSAGQPSGDSVAKQVHERYKNIKLYGYWRSSSTWRVRMVLDYKRILYETVAINLSQKENQSPAYVELNSAAQVPMIEVFDSESGRVVRLVQSVAIIDFLEDIFPETKAIYPRDAEQKAKVKEMVELVNAGIQPLQNAFYLERLETKSGGAVSAANEAHGVIEKGLASLEKLAKRNQADFSGPYCAGTFSPTIADFCVLPQLANGRRFNVDVDSVCPTLVAVETLSTDSSWYESSRPETQPDYKR